MTKKQYQQIEKECGIERAKKALNYWNNDVPANFKKNIRKDMIIRFLYDNELLWN